METTNGTVNNSYNIGNGVYEIIRVFNDSKSIKDIILEKITNENKQRYS